MGAAVPVAEPRWSGAHQGLALFLARLLAPLGDRPLAVPVDPRRPDGMLGGTLPPTGLQVWHSARSRLVVSLQLTASADILIGMLPIPLGSRTCTGQSLHRLCPSVCSTRARTLRPE
jgi:hypothetical protein